MKNPIRMYKDCNDYLIEKMPNEKTRLGRAIILLLACGVVVRFTPFIKYYWVNWCSAFVVKNWFWALLIGGILILVGQIDQILFQRKVEKEEQDNE